MITKHALKFMNAQKRSKQNLVTKNVVKVSDVKNEEVSFIYSLGLIFGLLGIPVGVYVGDRESRKFPGAAINIIMSPLAILGCANAGVVIGACTGMYLTAFAASPKLTAAATCGMGALAIVRHKLKD